MIRFRKRCLLENRDGWFKKLWNKKAIDLNEKFKHDVGQFSGEAF